MKKELRKLINQINKQKKKQAEKTNQHGNKQFEASGINEHYQEKK
jgi:hypothetical protein